MSQPSRSNQETVKRPSLTAEGPSAERPFTTAPPAGQRDIGFAVIVSLAALIALWLLWMPWSADISRATMRRFQLQTHSFLVWAVQFPIPAMYNFANRVEVSSYPPGLVDPLVNEPERMYLNHFPVRCITFADGRFRYLRDNKDCWITVETSYRGRNLESRFHVKTRPQGGADLIRLSSEETTR